MRHHTGFGSIVSSDICKISQKSSKRRCLHSFMVPEVIISKLKQSQKFAFYAHTLLKSFFNSAVLSAPWCVLTIFVFSYAILRFICFSNVGKFRKQFSFPSKSREGNKNCFWDFPTFSTWLIEVSKFQKQIFLFSFEPKIRTKLFFEFCPSL